MILRTSHYSVINFKKNCLIFTYFYKINKSNSTARAVQLEANLQEQLNDQLHFRKQICCQNAYYMFVLVLTVSEILTFYYFFSLKMFLLFIYQPLRFKSSTL